MMNGCAVVSAAESRRARNSFADFAVGSTLIVGKRLLLSWRRFGVVVVGLLRIICAVDVKAEGGGQPDPCPQGYF
jgi:hypothetical protein